MGKISKGILGAFSGKVGTVVGATWRSIAYMRSLPAKVKNPRTEKQLAQRTKFALVSLFFKPILSLLNTGWKFSGGKRTPFNAAMSHALNNAVTGAYPDWELDHSKILISSGTLYGVENGMVGYTASPRTLNFAWDANMGVGDAKWDDDTIIAVVNPAKNDAIQAVGTTTRTQGICSLPVHFSWIGDTVYVYLGFISKDGKHVSNSSFLGAIEITAS